MARPVGRQPIKAGVRTVTVSLRLSEDQRVKLQALGGAAWVRKRIERGIVWPEKLDDVYTKK